MSDADKQQSEKSGKGGPPTLSNIQEKEKVEEEAAETEVPEVPKGKLTIDDRVKNLEVGFVRLARQLEEKIGLSRPLTPEEASDAAERSAQDSELKQKVAAEREVRKYIKRDGGYRKDLSKAQKTRAKELLIALDRPPKQIREPKYDLTLIP